MDSLPENKLYANYQALQEVERMENVSQNRNPELWYQSLEKCFKLFSLNCRSLKKHILDIKADPMVQMADVMCFYETWLDNNRNDGMFNIEGYNLHLNSVGPGKGLAVYHRRFNFEPEIILSDENLQVSKLSGDKIDVLAIYRSDEGSQTDLAAKVKENTSKSKITLLVGDFNLCAVEDYHSMMSTCLREMGYIQLVTQPTHIQGL